MVWVKKSAAPDYVNALARVRLGLEGSADDWLLPWLNLIPAGLILDVNAFCGDGPPPAAEFTIDDFLGGLVGGPLGAGIAVFGLREKVNARAREHLFAILCEEHLTGGTHCETFEADILMATTGQTWAPPRNIIAGGATLKITCVALSTNGLHDMHVYWFAAGGYLTETFAASPLLTAVGQVQNHAVPATADQFQISTNGAGQRVKLEFCGITGTINDHVPDAIVQPDSAIPPEPGVYVDVGDLGAELDAIEQKLHWVLDYTAHQLVTAIDPLVADDVVDVVDPEEDVELGPDVLGVIVTITDIPGSTDERFGEPRQLHNLGRVVLGNGTAWLPPVPITVSPMLLLKTDATITAVRVQTFPPAAATVTKLVRAAPVG